MKLLDLLSVLTPETEVGIFNLDEWRSKSKYGKVPTRQTYSKVKNLKWGDIFDLLDLDVMTVNVFKDGLFIRIHDREQLEKRIGYDKLAQSIKERMRL